MTQQHRVRSRRRRAPLIPVTRAVWERNLAGRYADTPKRRSIVIVGRMSEQDKATELAQLRDELVVLESGTISGSHRADAPRYNEREIARVRARIAELEAELGI